MPEVETASRRLTERFNATSTTDYVLERVPTRGRNREQLLEVWQRRGYRFIEFYADWQGNWWDGASNDAIVFARRDWSRGCPTGREPLSLVDRVWLRDYGEPLVDVRLACPRVHVSARLPYLRERVAAMLDTASSRLPRGLKLEARTCLRTLARQRRGYEKYLRRLRQAHPSWPESILRRESYRFYHPPDHRIAPGHCTGGAVDVLILGSDGQPLDFDSPFERVMPHCRPYAPGLSEVARRNRDLLINTMEAARFSNCVDEWWHYSYGDGPWAVRMGVPICWYGLVEAPKTKRRA